MQRPGVFVERDAEGHVVTVSTCALHDGQEMVPTNSPDVLAYFKGLAQEHRAG